MGLFDDLVPAGDGGPPGALRITVRPQGVPDVPQAARPLLDAIAGGESPGYNTMYGGGKFSDLSDHPRQAVPIRSGPNAGKTSSAAGRYQFLGSTWDEVKKEAGLPDFSPGSQDAGAWHLANKTYKTKTGRDLESDLTSAQGNPDGIQAIGRALSGVWTSLPGGIEPNSMTSSFASRASEGGRAAQSIGLFNDLVPVSSPQETSPPAGTANALSADPSGGRFSDNAGENFRAAREGQSPAVATKGEAIGKGIARSATFNFLDELNAMARAGGLDPTDADGVNAAIGLIKGGYRLATGDKDAQETYRAEVSKQRADTERIQEQQPGASVAGEVGGALATIPFTGGAGAASLIGRAGQAARTGAIFGALSGAGEGTNLVERGTKAATGGAIGGTIGAVAAPVTEAVARGVGTVARETGRYLFPSVETRAANMVQNAGQSAARVDPAARTRLTPAEAAATPESTLADVTGEPGRAIARWAANASPEARETLNAMIDPRFTGQAHRVTGWLERTFHYPEATAQREAIRVAGEAVNNPNYARAMRDGAGGVWNAELQRLAGAPAVQHAAHDAIPSLSNRSITEGFRAPRQNPLTIGQDGRASLTTTPNGNQIVPDLRFWDQVKRGIDAQIGKAEAQGNQAKVAELTGLNNHLVAQLDLAVPSYGTARAGAAHFFGARDALQAGQEFVRGNMPIAEARRNLGQMTANERQLFQDGFISRYIQELSRVGDRRDILNKIAESPAAQQKLNLVLGPQRAGEFEAMLRVEQVMGALRNQVQGNSTTVRQLVEMGAVGTYGGVGAYMQGAGDPQHLVTTLIAGAFVGRGRNTDQRVARRVAEMLVSHDPAVLQRGLQAVARNRSLMDGIRSLDNGIGRIGGQQSTGVPAIQAAGIGRAENDQPQVQGP